MGTKQHMREIHLLYAIKESQKGFFEKHIYLIFLDENTAYLSSRDKAIKTTWL